MCYLSSFSLRLLYLFLCFTAVIQFSALRQVEARVSCVEFYSYNPHVLNSVPNRLVPLIKRYWESEGSNLVANSIAEGRSLNVLHPFRINMKTELTYFSATITVLTLATKKSIKGFSWFPIVQLGEKANPNGLDSTLVKFMSGLIKGIHLLKEQNPLLREVVIQAPSVQNKILARYLSSIGMELSQSGGFLTALTAGQISIGSSVFYRLKIRLE